MLILSMLILNWFITRDWTLMRQLYWFKSAWFTIMIFQKYELLTEVHSSLIALLSTSASTLMLNISLSLLIIHLITVKPNELMPYWKPISESMSTMHRMIKMTELILQKPLIITVSMLLLKSLHFMLRSAIILTLISSLKPQILCWTMPLQPFIQTRFKSSVS